MAKVLITGGSGSIGRKLIVKLQASGHTVCVIGRTHHKNLNVPSFTWDLNKGTMDKAALAGVSHIIHLAGAGIADKPWSPSRKQEIVESRVQPLQLLADVLKRRKQRIEAIISASAVGYYGAITTDRIFTEEDKPANDFLGATCKIWEEAVMLVAPVAHREVRIRTGIVLMKKGGALQKLAVPVKLGFGVAIGTGKQWMPWIHIDDLTDMYVKCVEDKNLHGVFNAVAPEHAHQSNFIKKVGKALHRPVFLPPVPGFLVRTIMGDMAKVITEGSRVSSQRVVDAGFEFKHPQLQESLNNLLQ